MMAVFVDADGIIKQVDNEKPVLVDRSAPDGYWYIGQIYHIPGKENLIVARMQKVWKPIGGKFGAIIFADLQSGEIVAKRCNSATWVNYANRHDLTPIRRMVLKIKIDALAEALGEEDQP